MDFSNMRIALIGAGVSNTPLAKYFTDKGVLIANTFPVMKHLLVYYFAYRMRNASKEHNFGKVCRLMKQGFREFKRM